MKEFQPGRAPSDNPWQNAKGCLGNLIPDLVYMVKARRDEIKMEKEAQEIAGRLRHDFETGIISKEHARDKWREIWEQDPEKGWLVNWNFCHPQPSKGKQNR